MDLAGMTDTEFYAHKRAVDEESSRRTRRATLPGQLAAMVADATDAGLTDGDVRGAVETALAGDDNDQL